MELYRWRPDKINKIGEIFQIYFTIAKYYCFRCDYTMKDYHNRSIPWNFSTFKWAIISSLRSWMVIYIMFELLLFYYNDSILIKKIEQLLYYHSTYIIIYYIIFLIVLLETVWFRTFLAIIDYRFPFNTILYRYIENDSKHLTSKDQQILIKFFISRGFVSGTINRLVAIVTNLLLICCIYYRIFSDQYRTRILSIFYDIFCYILFTSQIIFFAGNCFIAMFFLLFTVKFFEKRFRHLIRCYHLVHERFVSRFNHDYILFYDEIIKFNDCAKDFLFLIEMASKCSIVTTVVFYGQNHETTINVYLIMMNTIQIFFFSTAVYFILSFFPSYNLTCYKNTSDYNARRQYLINRCCIQNWITKSSSRKTIKSNLFIQSIAENRLGFSCGRLFFINRHKILELFLLNFIFAFFIYKKFFIPNPRSLAM